MLGRQLGYDTVIAIYRSVSYGTLLPQVRTRTRTDRHGPPRAASCILRTGTSYVRTGTVRHSTLLRNIHRAKTRDWVGKNDGTPVRTTSSYGTFSSVQYRRKNGKGGAVAVRVRPRTGTRVFI